MKHYEQQLESDFTAIRTEVAGMGERIQEAVKNAIHALLTGNRELSSQTVLNDGHINRDMRRINHLCHSFVARHLPSAGHLQRIVPDVPFHTLEEQQKLCIARLLPVKPDVLLMDEPCSALDPRGTEAVEELIWELRGHYTILIVTHNMSQARRASEDCIFMLLGKVIEHEETTQLFITPTKSETADYVEGRYG